MGYINNKKIFLIRFVLSIRIIFYFSSYHFINLNEIIIEWEVISINSTNIHLIFILDKMSIFLFFFSKINF